MSGPRTVDPDLLAEHPLPDHGQESSKRERGTVLILGGTAETPGAVLLAGNAALRAGAGTLQIATDAAVATQLAMAIPESRVVPTDPDQTGSLARDADAVLLGTGLLDAGVADELLPIVVEAIADRDAVLLLDAGALTNLEPASIEAVASRTVLLPNPAEVARMLDRDIEEALDRPDRLVHTAVGRFGCTVAVRGADTWITGPDRPTFLDRSGGVGLAASGSGDVLAGLLAGFAARGAAPLDAALWAVHVHGTAGERCAEAGGPLGFFAREVVDAVPGAIAAVSRGR